MTIRELAENLILNAEETPVQKIDLSFADSIVRDILADNSDNPENLPEGLTPESFMETFNDLIKEEDNTMEKTLYTAVIEAADGIHLIKKNIADPTGEYEDFEFAMQKKAEELSGELHCIYCTDDIVEDTTLE